MLKLGHISYSNCVPVHGRFLEQGPPDSVTLVCGVPGQLNMQLRRGEIDAAPASSIEYARHWDRYRLLPGVSISVDGPAKTIQLLSRRSTEELTDGARVALPTASATSVALLKIIMRQKFGIQPEYVWFEQERQDPLSTFADAALYIGDIAYRQRSRANVHACDLAELWHDWVGLPFVFALWQTGAGRERDGELRGLAHELVESRDWSRQRLPELAARYAGRYGWSGGQLVEYWRSLSYGWTEELAAGLQEFFARAAAIGEIAEVPEANFLELSDG